MAASRRSGAREAAPLPPGQRILSLDVLRGVAVLGILPINIESFAMIGIASLNPTAWGSLVGLEGWVFNLSYLLAEQEFMTLFAMLFAAGMLMIIDRVEAAGRNAAGLHYRRALALFAIGAAHAYLLWHNDVLAPYAQCALLVYPLRHAPPRALLVAGLLLYAGYTGYTLFQRAGLESMPAESRVLMEAVWAGHPDTIADEVAAHRGPWLDHVRFRAPNVLMNHTLRFLTWTLPRIGGVMLIGMALYRWGVFGTGLSLRFFASLGVAGLLAGVSIRGYGLMRDHAEAWSHAYSRYYGYQFVYWGSLCSAFGYLGVVTWLVRSHVLDRASSALAVVGRFTLSNYLLQTLICTTLFYGFGLGWFGTVSRKGQLAVVVAVWAVQVAASLLWARFFRFGPVEALWRAVSYQRLDPFTAAGTGAVLARPPPPTAPRRARRRR